MLEIQLTVCASISLSWQNLQISAKRRMIVLTNVGANLPKRDPVDTRVIEEVRTGKIVYSPMPKHLLGTIYQEKIAC
jgi:hypothetical protein